MLRYILAGEMGIWDIVVYFISTIVVMLLTLPIHEFAHGYVAVKLGDNTPRWQGRLTLNPLAHIDYIGSACLLLFGFGWAKAVRVNASNFRNPKRDMAITAMAGPAVNVLVAFLSLLLLNIVWVIGGRTADVPQLVIYIVNFFFYVAEINIYLAVFNLIPIPPLDGSRLLAAFLSDRAYYTLARYEQYSFILLAVLISSNVLDVPLAFLSDAVFNGVYFVADLPFKLLNLF